MANMNKIKALRLGIIGFEVLTIALCLLSVYTLFNALSTAISGGTMNLNLTRDESTGEWRFILNGSPRNTGFLGITLFFEVAVLDLDGLDIARNSTSVFIPAGGTNEFSLSLTIPPDVVPGGNLEEAEGYFELRFAVRTLADLVGFTNTLRIGGEASP